MWTTDISVLLTESLWDGSGRRVQVKRGVDARKIIRLWPVKVNSREYVVFYEDITGREEVQKVLEEKGKKLESILKFCPDAITATDSKGVITECNQATLDLHGFSSEEELVGKSVFDLIAPGDREKVAKKMKRTLERGSVRNVECVFLTKDGKEFVVEYSASVIKNSLGQHELFVFITKDISERKEREEQLFYLATHDSLTGAYNLELFHNHLGLAQHRAERNRSGFCIMMLDLDKFKNINDTLGHKFGDKLLQAVARRIRSALRKQDSIARMGGDEFLLLLPEISSTADINTVARRVLKLFKEPFKVEDRGLNITTSIGVAIYPDHGKDGDGLIGCADIAMYRAKRKGRNNYQCYT